MVNGPNPQSSIGWLDANAAEQKRVDELLRAFDNPGTVDSLGIGVIRDTLADKLAPGVSTAQTRLRYFLFIPWILQTMEGKPRRSFDKRLRLSEVVLIDQLAHLGPRQGVIGRRSRETLDQMPSSLYWSGLGRWGIRSSPYSDLPIAKVGDLLSGGASAAPASGDDDEAEGGGHRLWANRMPSPPNFFLDAGVTKELTLRLTRKEVEWLVQLLRETPATEGSYLTVAAEYVLGQATKAEAKKTKGELKRWKMPWDCPAAVQADLVDEHCELLRHAECFSQVILGPQILYNLLLAESAEALEVGNADTKAKVQATKASAHRAKIRDALNEWAAQVSAPDAEMRLAQWHRDLNGPDGLWCLLERLGGKVDPFTKLFVEACSAAAVNDPERLADGMRDRVREREVKLKGNRARLGGHRTPLTDWINRQMPELGRLLDYRWGVVQRYLQDVAEAR